MMVGCLQAASGVARDLGCPRIQSLDPHSCTDKEPAYRSLEHVAAVGAPAR